MSKNKVSDIMDDLLDIRDLSANAQQRTQNAAGSTASMSQQAEQLRLLVANFKTG